MTPRLPIPPAHPRSWLWIAATAALLGLASCAVPGLQSTAPSMPAERAALPPEYRLFYDALQDDGDWVLIEPYGQVFRPRVIFDAWQPYQNGFWAPSDAYGWVWISSETFGWATYHYGRWAYDRFQGWVWIPDVYWAPAWVSWEATSNYVGWSPIIDPGTSPDIPDGITTWTAIGNLATTDLSTRLVSSAQLGEDLHQARPIRNFVEKNGVRFNRGPSLESVERVTGFLPRVKIAEVNPVGRAKGSRVDATTTAPASTDYSAQLDATRKAGEDVAQQARSLSSVGAPIPARFPVVRPVFTVPAAPAAPESNAPRQPGRGKAQPDSTSR